MILMAAMETLINFWTTLYPSIKELKSVPAWPPDVFCLAATALQKSGAYSVLVDDRPPDLTFGIPRGVHRPTFMREIGMLWRNVATTKKRVPHQLEQWWRVVVEHFSLSLLQLPRKRRCIAALVQLLAAADEACAGVGISISGPLTRSDWRTAKPDPFLAEAEARLLRTVKSGSSLCRNIDPSRARVLPKMHTPQTGLTIRSLSHNVALCPAEDITPEWFSLATDTQEHALNLLVFPWPLQVSPRQFTWTRKVHMSDEVEPGSY